MREGRSEGGREEVSGGGSERAREESEGDSEGGRIHGERAQGSEEKRQ